jgi:MYXO-CTERM domain-containing protein
VPVTTFLDMSTNPSTNILPVPGFLSGTVDSHFLHFEDYSGVSVAGTVTFNAPIIGVIYRDLWLDNTDSQSGAFGTIYPTTIPGRGLNPAFSFIGINTNVLTFNFPVTPGITGLEQVRIFTVPGPGAFALAAAGGLIALRRRRNLAA